MSSDEDYASRQLDRIESMLFNLTEDLSSLSKRMDVMDFELRKIKNSTQNMDDHINFVESIYERIKSPFHRVIGWMGSSEDTNPLLIGE